MRTVASVALAAYFALGSALALAGALEYHDPKGDDDGPGTYTYPTDPVYKPGSFDLRSLRIRKRGSDVVFEVEIARRVDDPWNSKEWNGNGFSLQFVQIYLDTDHKRGSGFTEALPGINARFAPDEAWDRVVLLSPQPATRLRSEVKQKAPAMKDAVVIPRTTRVRGKKIIAVVPVSALGGAPSPKWGVQAVMQSNEGYPSGRDILTRKVNEVAGQHRFGGGSDWDCDPHVLDILAGKAEGDASEVEAQHRALHYTCGPDGDLSKSKLAVLPMIYRE